MNRRLDKLEAVIRGRPDPADQVDISEAWYNALDEVYGPDPDEQYPRPRVLVSPGYMENLRLTYGE